MAVKSFSNEELNFFKFASIVLDEFPKALRQTFITMWDNKIATFPPFQIWDDSVTIRNLLLAKEGGRTEIPTNKSINEWDCTALYKAIVCSKTFAVTTGKYPKTLGQQYLKGKKPSLFHFSVVSPSGNQDETFTLAVDQLRLLRNHTCHMHKTTISKADFDDYIQLAKDAFIATGFPTVRIDDIGSLGAEDFPTSKVSELNDRIKVELRETNKFLQQEVMEKLSNIESEINWKLEAVIGQTSRDAASQTIPDSCVPPLTPDFVGRIEERAAVSKSMMSARLFSIWGSPGFGKTSTAIAIGNQLKCQGESVYYFSFRGVNTMKEFLSKLLGLFGRATVFNRNANMTPADEILRAFGILNARVFLILDNLDDLLTSSDKKEELINFTTDVLHRCPNISFLTTTRESLESISYRVVEFDSMRLKPLDLQSAETLILKFLPSTTPVDIQSQILKMCGNVPLAIRLLCTLIKDSPREFLNEICHGSEGLLDVLDDSSCLSDDARLKQLIQVSFNKLSTIEKETFVRLSVFDGAEFELDAGIAVVGGGKLQAKRNIENLKRKSLIDGNGNRGEMYWLHPLIQSFALQKGEADMKDLLMLSKARFHEFYIDLFRNLNLRFLKGDSMDAFKTFFKDEHRILSSLTNGMDDDALLKKIVDVLQTCEFFLDGLYPNSLVEIELLYESALSKVFDTDIAGLYASKQFFATTFVSRTVSVLSPEDDEMDRRISLLPSSVQGKLKCYRGIFELSNGGGKTAAQLIEDGLVELSNNPEHVILKILAIQFLSIYYKCTGNSGKFKQFCEHAVETCSINSAFPLLPLIEKPREHREELDATLPSNHPLIVWTIARISLWTRHYPWLELDAELTSMLCEFLKKISRLPMTAEVCSLLQLCDMANVHLRISSDSSHLESTIEDLQRDVERCQKAEDVENAHQLLQLHHERLATYYHTIAVQRFGNGESAVELFSKELEIRLQLPLDPKLAECYRCIGKEKDSKGEYTSALKAYTSALKTLQKLHGKMHAEVATSFYNIGLVQDNMGDYESSLQSYLSALKISLGLYGGRHPHPIMIQERIDLHPFRLVSRGKKERCRNTSGIMKTLAPVKRSSTSDSKGLSSSTIISYYEICSSSALCGNPTEKEQNSETLRFRFFG